MKLLVFNGTISKKLNTANHITTYLKTTLEGMGIEVVVYNLVDHQIPIFSEDAETVPQAVLDMVELFRSCDKHIWLTPLYHGGMVGAMKNCLDWLIVSAGEKNPYLNRIKVALVCWAFGGNASSGIDNMRVVANTLRAWTLPYNVPIVMQDFYDRGTKNISIGYQEKLERAMGLLLEN